MARPDGYDALPKRFKDYIGTLEQTMGALMAARPSATPTSIAIINPLSHVETYLPDSTRLEFRTGPAAKGDRHAPGGETFQVYWSGRGRDMPGLEVSSVSGGLVVVPEASNVVRICARKW